MSMMGNATMPPMDDHALDVVLEVLRFYHTPATIQLTIKVLDSFRISSNEILIEPDVENSSTIGYQRI